MKTRSILPATLIALIALCLNPLFSSDLEMALLDIKITKAVQNFASGSTKTDDSTGSNSSNASTTTAVLIGESANNSSTNTPKSEIQHTKITIDNSGNKDTFFTNLFNDTNFAEEFCKTHDRKKLLTNAVLAKINMSLQNEWDWKAWSGYFALAAAYGYYASRTADYMQMAEWEAMPASLFCPLDQATADGMYDVIYKQQYFIATFGKVLYGSVAQCMEWVTKLSKKYQTKQKTCEQFNITKQDLTAITPGYAQKVNFAQYTLSSLIAIGSALVDSSLYKKYILTAINYQSPTTKTVMVIGLGTGLALDNFEDLNSIMAATIKKLSNCSTTVSHNKREHLITLFAKAQYNLQTCSDTEIEDKYKDFTAKHVDEQQLSLEQLQLLTTFGKGTDLPSRWKRNVTAHGTAALFTLANIYNWWVLGNGITDINVAKSDTPTAASAAFGVLSTLIFAQLGYNGMVELCNSTIDMFAFKNSQLPHANHWNESNSFKRIMQCLHLLCVQQVQLLQPL